ncbi:MAG: hypothetical protein HQK52_21800 [Oligoflexia bacterium]|nr:hypothetical protein [Oligoflexia bacterium]
MKKILPMFLFFYVLFGVVLLTNPAHSEEKEFEKHIESTANFFKKTPSTEELTGIAGYLKKSGDNLSKGVDEIVNKSKPYFQGWKPHYKFDRKVDADIITKEFIAEWKQPPYKYGTKIFEFTTSEPDVWVRLHGANNKTRSWMVRKESIKGLSPEQLKIKYVLPEKPTFITEVHVPSGTKIRKGQIGANDFGDTEGPVQYQLLDMLDDNAFKNTKEIVGVIE